MTHYNQIKELTTWFPKPKKDQDNRTNVPPTRIKDVQKLMGCLAALN
jgi:hypothetical protein